jgi:aminopeptidase-like protein
MTIQKYYDLAKNDLFPICRSITGHGIKKTLKIFKNEFPALKINSIKSGSNVFDWKVPPEWNVKDAYIIDKHKKKIIDFKKHNLHIVGYSSSTQKSITKKDLLKKLYSLPNQPDAIPYITSYYKRDWGFCISDKQKQKIKNEYDNNDQFRIIIKSNHNFNGNLVYGELLLKGKTKQEILISTNICHPSMANNELSGPIVALSLIKYFKNKRLNKSIRFVFLPETIGAIVFLKKNLNKLKKNLIGGYNLSCIGDERNHSCIFSKYKNSQSDKSLVSSYKKLKIKFKTYSFLERGSDERQYNSPGIDLPITGVFRSKFHTYPEYHTSLDDFKLVTPKGILGGFKVVKTAIEILQKKIIPICKNLGEPQMSKKNLYPTLSFKSNKKLPENLMNFLQYADGKNDLNDIKKKIKLNDNETKKIYKILKKNSLVN